MQEKGRLMMVSREKETSLRRDYIDEDFTRRRDGFVLPDLPEGVLDRIYKHGIWKQWTNIRLSKDRCMYVLPNGTIVLPTTIRRALGSAGTPHELLVAYSTIPNGQVKNFLNACRAVPKLGKKDIRVAVIGSKSYEGSGMWHKYFVLFLLREYDEVFVEFFDMGEREQTWEYELGEQIAKVSWIASQVEEKELRDYDVVIDDTWLEGRSGLITDVSPYKGYSIKGGKDDWEGYEPFLHPTETRKFSSERSSFESTCRCMVCIQISKSVENFEDYHFVRSLVSRLGHLTVCAGVMFSHDLVKVNHWHRELLTRPLVEVLSRQVRFLLALEEEEGIKVHGVQVQQGSLTRFVPYSRYRQQRDILERGIFPEFEGKRVTFAGVSSSILEATRTSKGSSIEPEITFLRDESLWGVQDWGNRIYIPVIPSVGQKLFTGWSATGRSFKIFFEYVRLEVATRGRVSVSKPAQVYKGQFHPPLSLYPWVNTSILPLPLREMTQIKGKGQDFTLVRDGVYLVAEAFQPSRWRESIRIEKDTFMPLRQFPVGIDSNNFLGLPTDIEKHEVPYVIKVLYPEFKRTKSSKKKSVPKDLGSLWPFHLDKDKGVILTRLDFPMGGVVPRALEEILDDYHFLGQGETVSQSLTMDITLQEQTSLKEILQGGKVRKKVVMKRVKKRS